MRKDSTPQSVYTENEKRLEKMAANPPQQRKQGRNMATNKNPYKRGNYAAIFDFMQSKCKGIFTRQAVIAFAMTLSNAKGKKLSEDAAAASVTVVMSPRAEGREGARGDCRGNRSAKGETYFIEPLKKVKDEDRKYRLRFRSTPVTGARPEIPSRKRSAKPAVAKAKAKVAKAKTVKAKAKPAVAKAKTPKVAKAKTSPSVPAVTSAPTPAPTAETAEKSDKADAPTAASTPTTETPATV
jgi:hypothetical protein